MAQSKIARRVLWLLLLIALGLAGLAVGVGTRKTVPPPAGEPIQDWDIPKLVLYLNENGLQLRSIPTQKGSDVHTTAFLTTTEREWNDLNRLSKDSRRIDEWRGTLYCERGRGEKQWQALIRQWGDYCLVAGPFLFFGDPQLLDRVHVALAALAGEERSLLRVLT
jgi:hypothetical protein